MKLLTASIKQSVPLVTTSSSSLGATSGTTSSNLTTTSPAKEPGLSDIFSFQGMLSALVSVVSQSLNQQAEQQNKLGQAILAQMQAQVKKIEEAEKKATRKKTPCLLAPV